MHILLQKPATNKKAGASQDYKMPKTGVLQAKLNICQPGDIFEQEADKVAARVLPLPEPAFQGEVVRQRVTGSQGLEIDANIESNINALNGGGQPLPETVRATYEPRFGYDFSHVRIHTDARAANIAESINAQAFTLGNDIGFAAGQYTPHTSEGQQILAHELTHVLQQGCFSTTSFIQRALTSQQKKKDLQSDRFKNDQRLQKAYDNDPSMKMGVEPPGPSVKRVQDALNDAGDYKTNQTGIFDAEMFNTVVQFQLDWHIDNDGKIGRQTLGVLDQLFTYPGGNPPPTVSDDVIVAIAKQERNNAMIKALQELRKLQDDLEQHPSIIAVSKTLLSIEKWLYASPDNLLDTVKKAIKVIDDNYKIFTNITIDRSLNNDYAHVGEIGNPSKGIVIENKFFNSSSECQREVMAHEYFHLSGLVHYYDTHNTDEALKCPHHMAELVFDIATGVTGGCGKPTKCTVVAPY